jgi:hypothetical protein
VLDHLRVCGGQTGSCQGGRGAGARVSQPAGPLLGRLALRGGGGGGGKGLCRGAGACRGGQQAAPRAVGLFCKPSRQLTR